MRSIKRVNVAFFGSKFRPAGRLYRAARFQSQFVEIEFGIIMRQTAFEHHSSKISVRADVIKAVIVDADMADVRRHVFNRVAPPDFQKATVVRRVELEQRGTKLKTLRPFRPATGCILAVAREDWCPRLGLVACLD